MHRSHYSGSGGYSDGGYSGGGAYTGGSSGGSSTSGSSGGARSQAKSDIISIEAIQKQLNDLGYTCGTVDGVKGATTVQQIKNFQIEYGLEADGYVDWQTEAWLNATNITYIREALVKAGYELDTGTGRSEKVVSAIKDFQQKKGLDVNGRIDLNTKKALGC